MFTRPSIVQNQRNIIRPTAKPLGPQRNAYGIKDTLIDPVGERQAPSVLSAPPASPMPAMGQPSQPMGMPESGALSSLGQELSPMTMRAPTQPMTRPMMAPQQGQVKSLQRAPIQPPPIRPPLG